MRLRGQCTLARVCTEGLTHLIKLLAAELRVRRRPPRRLDVHREERRAEFAQPLEAMLAGKDMQLRCRLHGGRHVEPSQVRDDEAHGERDEVVESQIDGAGQRRQRRVLHTRRFIGFVMLSQWSYWRKEIT